MQQVNLYRDELRPQRDWLSAQMAAVAVLVFVAALFIVQLVQVLRVNGLEEQVARYEAELETLQASVDQLKRTSAVSADQSIDQVVTQLESAIANRKKVGRILSGQNVGNAQGFAESMLSVARASNDDLSLQRFTLSRGGNYVEMYGMARNAKAVPLYLQRLKEAPVFQQTRFGLLSVSSEKNQSRTHEFSLGYDNVYQTTSAGDKK
jgi:hypothetical protein